MSKSQPVFHLAASSGLIAAGTGAGSVLFAWRNPSPTVVQFIHRVEVRSATVTGYGAGFENALELADVSSFADANYTGGTDLSHPSDPLLKAYRRINVDVMSKPKAESVLGSGNVVIAAAAGLAHAGAPVIALHPFASGGCGELAAGAAVPLGAFAVVWEQTEVVHERVPRPIRADQGFVVRNPVAYGAGGTSRLFVSVLWSEKP